MSIFSSVKEPLIVSLSFGLVSFCFAVLAAHAQTATMPSTPGWVVVPVEEYQSLRARAFPAEREPDPPPIDATLTRVDYDLRIVGDLATGRASLTVDVLKDGWVRVPVPSGLLVREARLDGKLVSLVPGQPGKGGHQLSAVLAHAGRAVLLLDIALPVVSSTGEESISLPSTSSGVTRAAVQLPRQGVDIRLSGGLLAEKSESTAESKWLAYARGNEPLTFTWRRKMEDHRLEQPLRLRGSLTQLLGLGEDATSLYAEVSLEVTQGAAREARIQLPDKITINQVSGAMVSDWEVKGGELAVMFLEPVETTARFVITGETRTARDGTIDVPILRLLNTERDTGGVAVEVLGAGEIKDYKSQGLENADAVDLGDMVASRQSPSLAAFRFRAGDAKVTRSLTVNVARYTQQAVLMANIEEARYNALMSNDGKILVQARYAVRNNQRNFLKITLPTGATIWSATLAGKPIRPGQSPDGSLLLPLEKARAGEDAPVFAVEVMFLARATGWSDKGKIRLALPAIDLPISHTGLVLYHPPLFRVTADPGSFRVETYENPTSIVFDPAAAATLGDEEKEKDSRLREGRLKNEDMAKQGPQSAAQTLVDNFKTRAIGGKSVRVMPIRVLFPAFGPALFFVSELTAENQAATIDLNYQRDKKEGGK